MTERNWRYIEIYWEDGTRTQFHRQDIEKLANISNLLRQMHSAVTIAEELLSLTRRMKE